MLKSYLSKEYLAQNRDKVIKVGAIILILLVAVVIFLIRENADAEESNYLDQPSTATEQSDAQQGQQDGTGSGETVASVPGESIVVDVSGAVNKPSVVALAADSRVEDAISAAGGLKEDADLSNINRAAFLTDGEKIVIPAKGKSEKGSLGETAGDDGDKEALNTTASDGKININTADSETLQGLTGIGPALAGRIVDYRQANGSFKKIEDLKSVSGIGEKTFEKLKQDITV